MSQTESNDDQPISDRVPCWQGSRISLTPLELDDDELIHMWRSDPVAAHEMGLWPRSLSAVRERIERDQEDQDRDDFVLLLPDGTPVGHVALLDQDLVDGTAEVVIMLAPDWRGQGLGTDALRAVLDLAFGELGIQRVEASTHTNNAACLAALSNAGFVSEGVRRSACLHRGRRQDLAIMAILRSEWEALERPRSWDFAATAGERSAS